MTHLKSDIVTVRRENFISTTFGVTLEQHANTIITDHKRF